MENDDKTSGFDEFIGQEVHMKEERITRNAKKVTT